MQQIANGKIKKNIAFKKNSAFLQSTFIESRCVSRTYLYTIYLSYCTATVVISFYLLHILTVFLRVSGCTGAPRSSVTTHLYFNSRSKYSDIPLVSNRESKPQRPTTGMYKPINHFRKPERNVYLEIYIIIVNMKNEFDSLILEKNI